MTYRTFGLPLTATMIEGTPEAAEATARSKATATATATAKATVKAKAKATTKAKAKSMAKAKAKAKAGSVLVATTGSVHGTYIELQLLIIPQYHIHVPPTPLLFWRYKPTKK